MESVGTSRLLIRVDVSASGAATLSNENEYCDWPATGSRCDITARRGMRFVRLIAPHKSRVGSERGTEQQPANDDAVQLAYGHRAVIICYCSL